VVLQRPELLSLPPDIDLVQWLLTLTPAQRERAIEMMGPAEREALDRDWASWAHEGQAPPPACADGTDWRTWVIMAGRGFGKTLAGSQWITAAVAGGEPLSIALVAATLDEARRVMVEGNSGLIAVADAWVRDWHPSLRQLRFRTGAVATLFSGASPEQLRGPEHHLAWCDELAKWEKPRETWDMLQFGLRLGDWPRILVTTTPRPGPVLKEILAEPDTVRTGGPTAANPHNSPAFLATAYRLYAGTRLGRQELDGELLTDKPGALWTVELLEKRRLNPSPIWGEGYFTRILIGVDPPVGDGTCGIIVCAKDKAGIAHVLADHSVTARSPEGWSRAVADAARVHSLSSPAFAGEGDPPSPSAAAGGGASSGLPVTIVAEKNQGGAMVRAVLHTADPNLRVKLVTATVGKAERAAPVAMLFEAGRVVLHGHFPELEAQLLGMIAGGEYDGPGVSPDRADAMVWGLTELMLGKERGMPQVRAL
jgi:phage terminase large subunit-like protein